MVLGEALTDVLSLLFQAALVLSSHSVIYKLLSEVGSNSSGMA